MTSFFQAQADDYENKLKEAELRFAEFQQSNNLVVLSQQKELTLQKTAEAKASLLGSEADIQQLATSRS